MIIITSVNKADVMWSFSVILSFVLSYCADNWRTRKRTSAKLGRHGQGWPSRSGWLLVVIRICAWIPVFHFLRHWGIGDFPFVSISVFSVLIQSTADLNQTWRNKWRRRMYSRFWDIRRTSGSRLIRKSEFASGSILFQILASAEVCTLYYRQNIFN